MSTKHRAARLTLATAIALATSCSPGPRPTPALDPAQLRSRFESLHRPIYEVYARDVDPETLWRDLADSFFGEALTAEYVEQFVTLSRMHTDDISIEILRVDYEDFEVLDVFGTAAVVAVDWSVGGVVRHQRHRHARVNRYRARYTLDPVDLPRSTRITDSRLLHLERVSSLESGSFPLEDLPSSARGFLGPAEMIRAGLFDEDAEVPDR